MKKQKAEKVNSKINGFKVNPALNDKYDDQPLFKDKVDRANHILKTVGIPNFEKFSK